MSYLVILVIVFSIIPSLLYFGQQRGRGPGWGLVAAGDEKLGQGAYRETRVVRWKRGKAPLVVRVAALSSFFLGQMVLPGGLAALVGIFAVFADQRGPAIWWVLELSAPTGLVVATFLLSAGWTMLESGSQAVAKARRAARWAIVHNLVLVGALGVAVAADGREVEAAIVPCLYAALSIAQALVVQRAARAIEAYDLAQKNDPAPLEEEIVAFAGVR
jgi:hypothetical protein